MGWGARPLGARPLTGLVFERRSTNSRTYRRTYSRNWVENKLKCVGPQRGDTYESKHNENNFEEFMSDRSGNDSDWSNVNKHQDINHREYLRREEFITKYVFSCKSHILKNTNK